MTDTGEKGPCFALLGSTEKMVRCGRPEDHRHHVPGNYMAHVYSPDPPDPDDPFEFEWGPLCGDCGGSGACPRPLFYMLGVSDSWDNHDGTMHCARCHGTGHVVGPLSVGASGRSES